MHNCQALVISMRNRIVTMQFARPNPNQQKGLAIITVMLIIALMVTLLGFLVEQQHLLIRRIANQNVAEQGYQYAAGVDAWAARVLHDDPDRATDHWGEDWARFGEDPEDQPEGESGFSLDPSGQREREKLPVIDFGNDAVLEFQLVDLMGLYNLNNLAVKDPRVKRDQRIIFLNLLSILEVGEFDEREKLYGALVDWLDANKETSANGAESSDYRIKRTPYHAADQKLTTIGELRFVEGFTNEIVNTLKPHVSVLPIDTAKININTTSTQVLAAMSAVPVLDTGSVATFLARRSAEVFQGFQSADIQQANNAIIGTRPVGGNYVRNMLQTTSQFFQINTRVKLGGYLYCTKTIVLREGANPNGGATPKVTILTREQSTLCDEIVR
ncbi:MAG: general secretion pathway protein K [Arenicella sp.]|jgi:general secretion pathway protein K